MKTYYLDNGKKIILDNAKPIGTGGEGSVFKLAKNPNILVKVYNKRALDRMPDIELKIRTMVKNKPGLLEYKGLTIIAWPSYVVYDENKNFIGYVMRKVQAKNQLSHVITPGLQKKNFPNLSWYDRLVVAINLSKVMSYLHQNSTVIGDINTSDFFVYPGFEIGLVDTDSFQVIDEKRIFNCKVFTPDYTPVEVIEQTKIASGSVQRKPDHDNYGLAILIFQIIMMGVHPFSARMKSLMGFDGNAINYNMEKQILPYATLNQNIRPPKSAMPFSFLPKNIQNLLISAFAKKIKGVDRPTAKQWVEGLQEVKVNIKKCKRNKSHYYPDHFSKCPICARERTKDYDYLKDYFKTISRRYIRYKTDKKVIVVDENHTYMETISGKFYEVKKKRQLALLFNQKLSEKYEFAKRVETLVKDPAFSQLQRYILKPKAMIYAQNKLIGYTVSNVGELYQLSLLERSRKIGKLRVTQQVRIKVAYEIASLFKILEKHKILVEYRKLYIDEDLNIYIPDFVLLGSAKEEMKSISFQKSDYLPYEYYLYLKQKKKRDDVQKAIEKEKEKQRQNDLELIRSPLLPKLEKKKDSKEETFKQEKQENVQEEDFAFEQSLEEIEDIEDKEEEKEIEVSPFDLYGLEAFRYRLSVIIHMLIHGTHPFVGTYKGVAKPQTFFVERNIYLHQNTFKFAEITNRATIVELFPKVYQTMIRKALFVTDINHIKRPSPQQWAWLLNYTYRILKHCDKNVEHFYLRTFTECPYCYNAKRKSHQKMRAFILQKRKNFLYYMAGFNQHLNYLAMIVISFGFLFFINQLGITNLSQLAGRLETVIDMSKIDYVLDVISTFFRAVYEHGASLIGRIFSVWI